jgi:hypothetical protein
VRLVASGAAATTTEEEREATDKAQIETKAQAQASEWRKIIVRGPLKRRVKKGSSTTGW